MGILRNVPRIPIKEEIMLKRRVWILLVFFIWCFYWGNGCYAVGSENVYLGANREQIEKGEEVEISVNIEQNKVAAFNLFLTFDEEKVECLSAMENMNIIGNRIAFVWFDSLGGEGAKKGELIKFRFKAKEEGLANFQLEGEFYNQKGQLLQVDFKGTQISIGEEENNLSKQLPEEQGSNQEEKNSNLQILRINREGMVPNFETQIKQYYLTIPTSIQEIEVLAVSENPNATVEITGNTNLKEGLNQIKITVLSEDKTQNTVYMIEVTKTSNVESANTNLEILAIENFLLNPPFDPFETNYKVEVSNETEGLHLLAVPENEEAIVEIKGDTNLQVGKNLLKIQVIAPNGYTKKEYEVEVYRRSLKEEENYQVELEEKSEELQNAYKIEELSQPVKEIQAKHEGETKQELKSLDGFLIFLWVVILGIGIWIIRKNVNKKKT